MSASPFLAAFPRRPIALITTPARRRGRIIALILCLLLFGPSLYWGYKAWSGQALRTALRDHGVMAAETLDADGSCTSRRGRLSGSETPISCDYTLTYRLRPEEGGELRQAPVHLDGAGPIFTPSAYYDPADPSRVMLKPEMDREMTWSELLGPLFLLLFPLACLFWWWGTSRRGLKAAAASPNPVIAPIEKAIRQMPANRLTLHFRPPGDTRAWITTLGPGEEPLLVRPPAGAAQGEQWVLALRSPKGRAYALDANLKDLDVTDAERAAIRNAAWA
ncbi:hypothetical protein [Allosphingosinicella sp.]|uniref:hypothetical protein n=1 Tax=Allosphingosinicella sp. TaxID=2823234 RepID=UPI003782F7A7